MEFQLENTAQISLFYFLPKIVNSLLLSEAGCRCTFVMNNDHAPAELY